MIRKLTNHTLTRCDYNYADAVNAPRDLYGHPTTLTYKGVKYVLGSGNADDIDLFKEGESIYIVSQNTGLPYIGLETIRLDKQMLYRGPFFQEWEAEPFMKPSTVRKQLAMLFQYDDY